MDARARQSSAVRLSGCRTPSKLFVFMEEHPDSLNDGYFQVNVNTQIFPDVPGRKANLHHVLRSGKISDRNPERAQWGAEPGQGSEHVKRIPFIRRHPDIDVPGGARHAMGRHRVSAHHEEACVFFQQTAKQIDEIFVQSMAGSPSLRTLTGQVGRGVDSGRPPRWENASSARGHIMAMRSSMVVLSDKSSEGSSPSRNLRTGHAARRRRRSSSGVWAGAVVGSIGRLF